MKTYYFFVLLLISSFLSCKTKKSIRNNELNRISVASQGNLIASITIDSNLTFYYEDNSWAGKDADKTDIRKTGCYTGKVSQSFWDTLNTLIEKMNPTEFDSTEHKTIYDATKLEFIIHFKDKKIRILGYEEQLNDDLNGLFHILYNIPRQFDTHPLFETQIQKLMVPQPPGILNKDLKVLPPR